MTNPIEINMRIDGCGYWVGGGLKFCEESIKNHFNMPKNLTRAIMCISKEKPRHNDAVHVTCEVRPNFVRYVFVDGKYEFFILQTKRWLMEWAPCWIWIEYE